MTTEQETGMTTETDQPLFTITPTQKSTVHGITNVFEVRGRDGFVWRTFPLRTDAESWVRLRTPRSV